MNAQTAIFVKDVSEAEDTTEEISEDTLEDGFDDIFLYDSEDE